MPTPTVQISRKVSLPRIGVALLFASVACSTEEFAPDFAKTSAPIPWDEPFLIGVFDPNGAYVDH